MIGLAGDARRLLLLQCGLMLVMLAGGWIVLGKLAALSVGYGAATAMLNSWLSSRRLAKALAVARTQPGRETSVLYVGAVQRFALMAAAFMTGMGPLQLAPGPLLVGFAAAYSAILFIRPGVPPSVPSSRKIN